MPSLLRLFFVTLLAGAWLLPATASERVPKRYTIEQFLATTSFTGASFSADESKLLFSSNASGIWNAYTLPASGGTPQALTTSSTDSVFAISYFPDDDRVLFTRDQAGNELNHLFVRELDGRERDLTPGEKLRAQFRGFSPDGAGFFVTTNERDPRFFDLYRYDAKTYV
jgi:Tol biopolymer transport system component